jgi:hypothetical protein
MRQLVEMLHKKIGQALEAHLPKPLAVPAVYKPTVWTLPLEDPEVREVSCTEYLVRRSYYKKRFKF